jgi:protein TonB
MDAALQWKYRPFVLNGEQIPVATTVRLAFSEAGEGEIETSTPQAESPVQITIEGMRGRLVYRVAPLYPPLARQARIQGTVVLRIIINKLGEVRDVELVSGHPMLAPAAIEAVKKWRYMPYESDGKAVETQTEVQVIFSMPGA